MQVKVLGRVDYLPTYRAMQAFTEGRRPDTPDEMWICEHPPVFTQGLAGKADHLLEPGAIPVVATNRGGQVTYHGPGQVVAYPLIDLQRAGYFVKEYVYRLEEAVLRTLADYGVTGHRVRGAPGIYVRRDDPFSHARLPAPPPSPASGQPSPQPSPASGRGSADHPLPLAGEGRGEGAGTPQDPFEGLAKIAALGIKVSRHCTYHGLAFNVAMDLQPFRRINPCGYAGLETVDLSTIGVSTDWNEAAARLGHKLQALLAP
ncbi:MAG TPA: lipoyl(octanoyl) transferase LipB [Ramlibacter sp.]|uniref:lipoyl(octanoyl) transferase LipB n=1 Tax=Ramlibacter sp. TaxID=1917967 RepID=UPI002D7FED2A|nr:lipoyl(octanoyl) transferase LipB [Ramlibacter sp.]HET8744077.1 lipoyl(octanoyl) transferase LipB [Ramlibacter sp.]